VFWELGAAWGYFSITAATRVAQVCSFEMMAERVGYLEEAIEANELDNVIIVDDKLEADTDFTEYPDPDVVLVDIEGWEYPVLSTILEQCSDVSTWVVEVHSELRGIETADPVGEIEQIFNKKDYNTSTLNPWSENNVHIVARK
jgi:tRNA G37 N-methylase Trm5